MNQVSTGTSRPAFGFVKILGLLVVICITITTITHYIWPELTGVPSNPANVFSLLTSDITVAVMGIAAFLHGRRTMGTEKAAIFLVSAVLFSGIEETAWILSGRFGLVAPTYYFTSGGLWFFEIPVYTCIAWYLICYCGYAMVKQLLPRMRPAGVAALVAAFGTCWDLWLDPVVCNRHLVSALPDMWIWLSPSGVRLFGIPVLNFAGWFGVIFAIIYVFDKKLRPVEQLAPKNLGWYYIFLAAGWGILFLALHGVGALQYFTIVDIFPVAFGIPVDPAVVGTGLLAAALLTVFIALLVVGSAWASIQYRKRQEKKVLLAVPVLAIGWWLMAGLGMASQLLATYPGSSLGWLMLACSAYPTAIVVASILKRVPSPENHLKVVP
jgi:hypothetical protein